MSFKSNQKNKPQTNIPWFIPKFERTFTTRAASMKPQLIPVDFKSYVGLFLNFVKLQGDGKLSCLQTKTPSFESRQLLNIFTKQENSAKLIDSASQQIILPHLSIVTKKATKSFTTYSIYKTKSALLNDLFGLDEYDPLFDIDIFFPTNESKICNITTKIAVKFNTSSVNIHTLFTNHLEIDLNKRTNRNNSSNYYCEDMSFLLVWFLIKQPNIDPSSFFTVYTLSKNECICIINFGVFYFQTILSLFKTTKSFHHNQIVLQNLLHYLNPHFFNLEDPLILEFYNLLVSFKGFSSGIMLNNIFSLQKEYEDPSFLQFSPFLYSISSPTISYRHSKRDVFSFLFNEQELSLKNLLEVTHHNPAVYYANLAKLISIYFSCSKGSEMRFNDLIVISKSFHLQIDKQLYRSVLNTHNNVNLFDAVNCFTNVRKPHAIKFGVLKRLLNFLTLQLSSNFQIETPWWKQPKFVKLYLILSILIEVKEQYVVGLEANSSWFQMEDDVEYNEWISLSVPFSELIYHRHTNIRMIKIYNMAKAIYETFQIYCLNLNYLNQFRENSELQKILKTANTAFVQTVNNYSENEFMERFRETKIELPIDYALFKTNLQSYKPLFNCDKNSFLNSPNENNQYLAYLIENQAKQLYKSLSIISLCFDQRRATNLPDMFPPEILKIFNDLEFDSSETTDSEISYSSQSSSESSSTGHSFMEMEGDFSFQEIPVVDNGLYTFHRLEERKSTSKKRKINNQQANTKRRKVSLKNNLLKNIRPKFSKLTETQPENLEKRNTFKRTRLKVSFKDMLESYVQDSTFHVLSSTLPFKEVSILNYDADLVSLLYELICEKDLLPNDLKHELLLNITLEENLVESKVSNDEVTNEKKPSSVDQQTLYDFVTETQQQLYLKSDKYQFRQLIGKSFHNYNPNYEDESKAVLTRHFDMIQIPSDEHCTICQLESKFNSVVVNDEKFKNVNLTSFLFDLLSILKSSTSIMENACLDNNLTPRDLYRSMAIVLDTMRMELPLMKSQPHVQYGYLVDEEEQEALKASLVKQSITSENESDFEIPTSPNIEFLSTNCFFIQSEFDLRANDVSKNFSKMSSYEQIEVILDGNIIKLPYWVNTFFVVDLHTAFLNHQKTESQFTAKL